MSIITYLQKLFTRKPKIIVIAGQTSTGKSDLAVDLAKAIGGEVVSADSRQIYKGLDLSSGKITPAEMRGIPHHMIDLVTPLENYSVADFAREGTQCMNDIFSRGNIPIVCGGTGFYIDALVSGTQFNEVRANRALRKELANESTESLYSLLKSRAPKRALEIDPDNKQRIIRSLEIFEALGEIPKQKRTSPYQILWICATRNQDELKSRIKQRIINRLNDGMLEEIKELIALGVSHTRLEGLGLECRYMSRYLRDIIDKETMIQELAYKTNQFAKRQKTWFKRNKKYHRLHPENEKGYILEIAKEFIKK